jgi:hypothetical protein
VQKEAFRNAATRANSASGRSADLWMHSVAVMKCAGEAWKYSASSRGVATSKCDVQERSQALKSTGNV